jgi:hypothetical protein
MSGVKADATDDDGRGAPGYGQSCALQRLGAVNWCFRCSPTHAEHDLRLPKAPEAAIIARNCPESSECRL